MNKTVKTKWLAALRSADYPQTQRALRDDKGFCCLGVLCDLAVKENVVEERAHDERLYYSYGSDGRSGVLPVEVINWADLGPGALEGCDPSVMYEGRRYNLSHLNDQQGLTFDEIADLVEEQL